MDEEIYLIDILAPVLAKWKVVFVFSLIGACVGLVFALRSPRMYESSVTMYVQQSSGASSILSSLPIALPMGGSGSIGYFTTILQSDTLMSATIADLDIKENKVFNKGKPMSQSDALEEFRRCVKIKDDKSGSLRLTVKMRDPRLAADAASLMLARLEKTIVHNSKRKSDFISTKLEETTRELQKAENALLKFQQSNDCAMIDEQTRSMIQQLSVLDGQLLAADVELESTLSDLDNAGDLNVLADQEVRKKSLEASREYINKQRSELYTKLKRLPAVTVEYIRLQRNVGILTKTFELLTEQYQLASIKQQGEDGDYQIIDRPQPADKPLSRGTMSKSVVGALFGCMFSSIIITMKSMGRMKRKKGIGQPAAQ